MEEAQLLGVKGQPGRLSEDDSLAVVPMVLENPCNQEAEIGKSYEFKASLVYLERPCLKTKKTPRTIDTPS